MKPKHGIWILALAVIGIVFISGCVGPGGKPICPPAGFPQPPGCEEKTTSTTNAVPSVSPTIKSPVTSPEVKPLASKPPEIIDFGLTVTVPYWTTGDVYLGVGDNTTYLKLNKVNEVTYKGTTKLEKSAEYYYSRGSPTTKSTTIFKTTDLPKGINAVIDWVDSNKKISLPGFQKGVIFGGMLWKPEELAIPGIIDYNLDMAKSFGVEWIGLVNTWYGFPDCREGLTEMRPFYATDGTYPDTQGWSTPTLTDVQMKEIISKAKARGMKVMLKPIVTSFGNSPERPWGCHFAPAKGWDLWFLEYTKLAVHFAKLAQETGTDIYSIGTELDMSSIEELKDLGAPQDATERWRKVIKEVRKHYSGKLTYSTSCSINPEKWEEFPCHAPGRIKFWDDLDYIGIEPYFPITNKINPTLTELKDGFGGKIDSPVYTRAKELYEKYKKPIIFNEYSLRSYDGANKYQQATPLNPTVDLQEQADMQEAMMQVSEERPWLQGGYHWAWYLIRPDDNMEWQLKDINTFTGKPGGQVLKKWYSKIGG